MTTDGFGDASAEDAGAPDAAGSGLVPVGGSPIRVSVDVSAVPDQPAGAGRYVVDLTAALVRRDDVLLTLLARRDDALRWEALQPSGGVVAVAPRTRPPRLLWEQVRLPGLIDRLGVDTHHAPHYTMPERSRRPVVVTVHDLTFLDHPEWHERSKVALFRRAIAVASRHAAALVCVSRRTADQLVERCRPTGRVFVAHHGVDAARFRPAGGKGDRPGGDVDATLLSSLGVDPSAPYLLFVGTLEPRKNVPGLVAAFDRVADRHPDARLVLAGSAGWGVDEVRAAIAHARHGERVRTLGYVPDEAVPALLRRSVAAVYPALEEGFGLPALEALACGVPLVTSAGTVMAEVAGHAALVVPPGDTASLADALDEVLDATGGTEARRQLGLDVAGRYTWEASADVHVDAYRWAAEQGRPGRPPGRVRPSR